MTRSITLCHTLSTNGHPGAVRKPSRSSPIQRMNSTFSRISEDISRCLALAGYRRAPNSIQNGIRLVPWLGAGQNEPTNWAPLRQQGIFLRHIVERFHAPMWRHGIFHALAWVGKESGACVSGGLYLSSLGIKDDIMPSRSHLQIRKV